MEFIVEFTESDHVSYFKGHMSKSRVFRQAYCKYQGDDKSFYKDNLPVLDFKDCEYIQKRNSPDNFTPNFGQTCSVTIISIISSNVLYRQLEEISACTENFV